ncbi:putative Ig domain-containing protein [Desulfonema magnum]|uniref:putative Ig domain-containing protein n=1 Tax=Desulfonema magnum TaxID=45655 RepID=UPI001A9AFBC8|nr:putative Ig domain-containing protein [Desulfonema magnum]
MTYGVAVSIPVRLNETTIENVDIEITGYDAAVLEATSVTLAGGILENQTDYAFMDDVASDRASVVIFARGDLVTASGDLLFVTFNVIGEAETTLSFSKFECNELACNGGFNVNDRLSQSLKILINHAPVADDGALETDEDNLVSGMLTASDTDADPLTYTILSETAKGTVEITDETSGEFTYTPYENENGTDTFTYQVSDGTADSDIATFTIEIHPVNDLPVFTSTSVTAATQDAVYTYAITASDVDITDILTITALIQPDWLDLTDNGDRTATFTGTPGNDHVGEHPLELQVKDTEGGINTQSFMITVANINDPPVFDSLPVTDIEEDTVYTYSIATTDIDLGDTRTVTAPTLPEWLELTDNGDGTATLTGTPGNDHVGEHPLELQVKDADGSEDTQPFTITVKNINDAPVFESTPVIEVAEDTVYTYSIVSTDIDLGDTRTIIASALPDWLTLTYNGDGTATLEGTPANEDAGVHDVVLQVTDAGAATDTQIFSITVTNVNDTPLFSNMPVTNATEDEVYTYNIATSDPDAEDIRTITAPILPEWLIFTDNGDGNALLTGTPENKNVGAHEVSLQVKDMAGATDALSFVITVANVNDPPVFKSEGIPDATEDVLYTYDITTKDPDKGDARTITAPTLPSWLTLADHGDGTASLTGTPLNDDVGDHDIRLKVRDTDESKEFQEFIIHVENINDAPILESGGNMILTAINEDVADDINTGTLISEIIASSGTDAVTDADAAATEGIAVITADMTKGDWQYDENRDGIFTDFPEDIAENKSVLLKDTALIRFVPHADFNGKAEISFRAWDQTEGENGDTGSDTTGNGGTSSFSEEIGTAIIVVQAVNDAPVVSGSPSDIVNEDSFYSFIPTANDTEAEDVLTFSVANPPMWADFNPATGEVIGTPGNDDVGTTEGIVISVSDGTETVSMPAFDITVVNTNDPPAISGSPPTNADEDSAYSFTPAASDEDAEDTLSFSVTNLPEWASFDEATGEVSGIPGNDDVGTTEGIVISVSDGTETVSLEAFDIAVINTNDAPTISGTPPTSVDEDTAYSFTPIVSDEDAETTLNFSVANLPEWASFDEATGELSGTPGNDDVGTTEGIVISVSDGTETVSLEAFDIAVINTNDAPTISGTPPTSVDEDTAYSFTPIASDEDTDTLSFSVANLPEWASFDEATGELSGTPENDDVGTTEGIVISVSDGTETVSLEAFDIAVINTNDAPTISGTPPTSVDEDTAYSFTPIASDEDTDTLSFSVANLPEWASFDETTGELSGTPENDDVGMTESIIISVSDETETVSLPGFDIIVINTNDAPVITGQNELGTEAKNGLTITLDDLTVTDPDNTFPDDFTLTVLDGENYTREENIITPEPGFNNTLTVPVKVNDGQADSEVFNLSILVTETNEPVVITGQRPLSVRSEDSLTIILNDLEVTDPENTYPQGFSLVVPDGENYTREDKIISPLPEFKGTLTVPVKVNDGTSDSNVFDLRVTVIKKDEADDMLRSISGTIKGLAKDQEIWVNVLSRSLESSEILNLTGTGDDIEYTVENLKPASDYRVEISSSHYFYQVYHAKDDWEDADFVDLSNDDAAGIDFTLIPDNAVISGTVIFPDGASPAESARIDVYSPSTGARGEAKAVLEEPDTREVPYEVTGLLHGDDYIVSVWPDNYKSQYYDATEIEGDAKEVDTDSPNAKEIHFILQAGVAISGTIFGEDVAGTYVEAWSEIADLEKGTIVSEDGTYVIEGLKLAPDFKVKAQKANIAPFFYHEAENAVRSIELASLVSTENGNPEHIDITMDEGEIVTGIVQDENGNPVAGVWIEVQSESGDTGYGGIYTSEHGTYELKGIPADEEYKISAKPDWSLPYSSEESSGGPGDGNVAELQVKLREAYKIEGMITDENGSHISNVNVEISSDSQKFHGWSTVPAETNDLHILKPYEISGLPPADDYVITARPPESSSYAVFTEKNISIHSDTVMDITLTSALEIRGAIQTKDAEEVKGVKVIIVSGETNFRAEVITDKDGFYEITNMPDASDYVITTVSDEYTSQEEPIDLEEVIDIGIVFTLEEGSGISGEVKDKITGDPLPGIFVGAYSESMRDIPNYSGVAVTDEKGCYTIEGLQKKYEDGTVVNDYVVGVNAEDYPPSDQSGKAVDEKVDFFLDHGGSISGRITGLDDKPDDVVLDLFENKGNFIKSVVVKSDGSFDATGLSFDKQYQLRFTAFLNDGRELIQWADEEDIGFDDPDPNGNVNPVEAKVYETGETINFRFDENSASSRKGEGRSRNSCSDTSENPLKISSVASDIVTNSPEVTVKWESSSENPDEKYYHLFNRDADFAITKRNAPRSSPVKIRRVTSQSLTGDDVGYAFHVASVDERGRIGKTASLGFNIDTVPPSSPTVTAPPFTLTRDVSLTLGATGASEVYISNTTYGEGYHWEKLIKTREWKLTQGEGLKKIYVQFRDRAGNTANAVAVTEKVSSMPDHSKITAQAGENGTITPSGEIMVCKGDDVIFAIVPDDGYETDKVFIDGVPVTLTGIDTYTFQNVSENASVTVTFKEKHRIRYTITANAGPHGAITPSGKISVYEGDDQAFEITPNDGYEVDTVLVDGKCVRLADDSTFNFINITRNPWISVTFKPKLANSHKIIATAGPNGTITPSGLIMVTQGENMTFTITPAAGYEVGTLLADEEPVTLTPDNTYTFPSVTAGHKIHVIFN